MIALRGVTKRFGDEVVLDGLDLALPEGRYTALMGPNGSGKTTIARLLLGLVDPDAGVVEGVERRARAAVFQEDRLCEHLTAVGNVRLVLPRSVGATAVVAELAAVGLTGETLGKPVRGLSGGQRRRVAICRAMVRDADLVVLDEPFTGLDAQARTLVLPYVRDRCAGRTTLLITHDRTEADYLDAPVVTLGRSAPPPAERAVVVPKPRFGDDNRAFGQKGEWGLGSVLPMPGSSRQSS